MSKSYYVYFLTNPTNRVLYIGVTSNLERRMFEHKNKLISGFTEKYNATRLVYYEETHDVHAALNREKQFKRWRRAKKDVLVQTINPEWNDLSADWF